MALAGLAAQAQAATPVTFQLSWKAQAEFGGYYQALAKGYYAACGVDMTLREGAPGMDPSQLLTAGAVDAAMVPQNDGAMLMNKAGFAARAVLAGVQKAPAILLYHEESGIRKPEDLLGRPILLSASSRASIWPYLKAKYGFRDDQLRAFSGQMATWLADKTAIQQGVVTQDPYRFEAETGKPARFFQLAELGYNPYSAIMVVSQKMIDEKPAVVQCMVSGSRKGWADFMKDPEPAFQAIRKLNPQQTPEVLAYAHRVMRDNGMVVNDGTPYGAGSITEARWKAHFDLLVQTNVLPATFDYRSTFTTRFLEQPLD